MGGQKATSIVLRPDADLSADMLFLEYRGPSGAAIAMAVPVLTLLRSCAGRTALRLLLCCQTPVKACCVQ